MWRAGKPVMLPTILVLVAAGTLASNALTPRDLSMGEDAAFMATSGNLLAFDVSRVVSAAVLLVTTAGVLWSVIQTGFPRAGLSLWGAYLAFVVSNYVLPAIAGRAPGFDLRLLIPPGVFTAIYFARPMGTDDFLRLCKFILCGFIYASLAAGLLVPAQSLAVEYAGLVPGLSVRLYGVGGGAGSLATQAVTYLVIEWVRPSRSRLRIVHVVAAVAALILTQAKTLWVFVLLGLAYVLYRRAERWLSSSMEDGVASVRRLRMVVVACSAIAGVLLVALLGDRLLAAVVERDANILTLTGRTYIWETSLRVWRDNPMFGYGVGLWEDPGFRAQYGAFAHAHNQFIHALASAGVVGLAGLVTYLWAAWAATRRASATSRIARALLLLEFTLALTDLPLGHHFVLDAFTLLHLLMFALLMQVEKLAPAPRWSRVSGAPSAARANA